MIFLPIISKGLRLLAVISFSVLLAGCGGAQVKQPADPYASYDCEKLFEAMTYQVDEANLLYTNGENEESLSKFGWGTVQAGAGAAMATTLLLTPLGWALAGAMMLGGAGQMADAVDHDAELSDEEHRTIAFHNETFASLRQDAIGKDCDYKTMLRWQVG